MNTLNVDRIGTCLWKVFSMLEIAIFLQNTNELIGKLDMFNHNFDSSTPKFNCNLQLQHARLMDLFNLSQNLKDLPLNMGS